MRIVFAHLGREQLGIEYLSSALKKEGHEVFLANDPDLFGLDDNVFYIPRLARWFSRKQSLLALIQSLNPDLIAFSCYTSTFPWAVDLLGDVRNFFRGPTVFGGIHVTLTPDSAIGKAGVDYAIRGEGDRALPLLVNALAGKGGLDQIPGLVWRDGPTTRRNPLDQPVDLDTLPFPDKGLFEKEVDFRDDYLVMTSRGCPNRCTYCCERNLKELYGAGHYRRRSPGHVIEELLAMKRRYRFREVMFYDAVFALDKQWLRDFLSDYVKQIGVKFRCLGHVRFLDDEMAELLRRSGCYNVEFGLQTINEQVRFDVLQRMDGNEEHARAFRACDRAGLRYDINHMFGLPGEAEQDFVEAAHFYAGLKMLNRVKVFYLTYFPKLEIGEIARQRGLISQDQLRDFDEGKQTGSYFHLDVARGEETLAMHRRFAALYKIVPLLSPARVQRMFGRPQLLNCLGRMPFPLVVFFQLLVAIRGRDYRFPLMAKYLVSRLARGLLAKVGMMPLPAGDKAR